MLLALYMCLLHAQRIVCDVMCIDIVIYHTHILFIILFSDVPFVLPMRSIVIFSVNFINDLWYEVSNSFNCTMALFVKSSEYI